MSDVQIETISPLPITALDEYLDCGLTRKISELGLDCGLITETVSDHKDLGSSIVEVVLTQASTPVEFDPVTHEGGSYMTTVSSYDSINDEVSTNLYPNDSFTRDTTAEYIWDTTTCRYRNRFHTFTINPTPSSATVLLAAAGGYTQSGNSITVREGVTISYNVSKEGYFPESGTYTMGSDDYSMSISLNQITQESLTIIPTPLDSTVTLSSTGIQTVTGTGIQTIVVTAGSVVDVTVSRTNLVTQNLVYTVNTSMTENVVLSSPTGTVLFESSNPGTYTITPITPSAVKVICIGAGAGGCAAYITVSGGGRNGVGAASGASGGYSEENVTLPAEPISIVVGKGGTTAFDGGASTTVRVQAGDGGSSSVSNLVSASGGKGGFVQTSYNSRTGYGSATPSAGAGGTGTTSNGNAGITDSRQAEYLMSISVIALGAESVYNGYGKGGRAAVGVKAGDVTGYTVEKGSSGYVKIVTV